jgi:hypothetical protein
MPLLGRKNVDSAIDDLYTKTNDNLRGVYFAGLINIVQETPVDEGRARNNWFLSVSTPSSATTTSKAKGLGAIRQLRSMPKRVLNRKIYYTNNLPYVALLEYGGYPSPVKKGSYDKRKKKYEILSINGFSKQAPNGWVRKTLIEMQNKIRALS